MKSYLIAHIVRSIIKTVKDNPTNNSSHSDFKNIKWTTFWKSIGFSIFFLSIIAVVTYSIVLLYTILL